MNGGAATGGTGRIEVGRRFVSQSPVVPANGARRACKAVELARFPAYATRAFDYRILADRQKKCIDCHRGIAHKPPKMAATPLWQRSRLRSCRRAWLTRRRRDRLIEPLERHGLDEMDVEACFS